MTVTPTDASWQTLRTVLRDRTCTKGPGDDVIEAARRGEVLGMLGETSPLVARQCREELARTAAAQMHVTLAVQEIARILDEGGIGRAALLKGNATGLLLYPAPHLRPTRDVDVLVDPADFPRVLQLLRDTEWLDAVPPLSAAAFGDLPFEWCFDRTFGSVQLQCDVHQRLISSDTLRVDHGSILDRAEAHPESPLPLCHPEDLLLGGVLHAAKDSFDVPLKSWWDLALLAVHPRVSLERCVERARQWAMGNITWACFRILNRWNMVEVPPELLDPIKPPAPMSRLLDAALSGRGGRAPRWPAHRRWGYFLPGPLMGDGPRAAARWMSWRASSLLRAERRRWSL